jgi:glutathione S-transferase
MHSIHLVAALAVLQYFFFGIMVGRARSRYGVKAPATTGHEQFERAFRVQMNTLEQLAGFLPALYIAGQYCPAGYVAAAGVVYLIGRFVYWRAYVANPTSRGLGFLLTVLPTFALLAAGVVGAVLRLV